MTGPRHVWVMVPAGDITETTVLAVADVAGLGKVQMEVGTLLAFRRMAEVAQKDGWDRFLPEIVLSAIRIKGHYYAVPVNIHMPTWIWYSKAAFKQAGISAEPRTMDELFAALDKLKAAGLVPLAHGGQAWQDNTVFTAVLTNVGGRELYLKVLRDRAVPAFSDTTMSLHQASFMELLSLAQLRGWSVDQTAATTTANALAALPRLAGLVSGCAA